jgi:hypothetical protein
LGRALESRAPAPGLLSRTPSAGRDARRSTG